MTNVTVSHIVFSYFLYYNEGTENSFGNKKRTGADYESIRTFIKLCKDPYNQ